MDVDGVLPYVWQRMNLLLLLSAMLTALSGGGLGVRAPQVPVSVNSVATFTADVQAVAVKVAGRPVGVPLQLSAAARAPLANAFQLAPAAPLYLSRRRE